MSSSRIARKRPKSVLPLARVFEPALVLLPFIAVCPPCRNHSPPCTAHHVDHYDFNVFHETDGKYAIFTMTGVHSLEHWPVKYSFGIPKIDVMFCEIRLSLALIPLEKHLRALASTKILVYVHYVHTTTGLSSFWMAAAMGAAPHDRGFTVSSAALPGCRSLPRRTSNREASGCSWRW